MLTAVSFSRVILNIFFSYLANAHLRWFGDWGFGIGVLKWVIGVGDCQLIGFRACGVGPVVWGLMGCCCRYKHRRINLGKKPLRADLFWVNIG